MDSSRPVSGTLDLAAPAGQEERASGPHVRRQVLGLDGLRGLAALYVVLFHCWLYTFPGYPDSSAPPWLDGLMFGRLAVVFFLVLSGFSLAISPARHGWRSGGVAQAWPRRSGPAA